MLIDNHLLHSGPVVSYDPLTPFFFLKKQDLLLCLTHPGVKQLVSSGPLISLLSFLVIGLTHLQSAGLLAP